MNELPQAPPPHATRAFGGVQAHAGLFRDAIRRWRDLNQRTASPLFLFGESYGTLRSTVLAERLESAGVPLAGVILQSTILDYNSNCAVFAPGTVDCTGFLPSYAAVGAWFELTRPAQPDLSAYMGEMRSFAALDYQPAVAAWLVDGLAPAPDLLGQLVDRTGLGLPQWQLEFSLGPGPLQRNPLPGRVTRG